MLKRIYGLEAATAAFKDRSAVGEEHELLTDGGGIYSLPLAPEAFADRVIADVSSHGDEFIRRITRALDGAAPDRIEVPADKIRSSRRQLRSNEVEALELAADRVRNFQRRTLPKTWRDAAAGYGEVVHPVKSVGCCIPGGTAPLASTVIMTAVPAKVAGVPYVCVVTPAGEDGTPHPAILAACEIAGVDAVFA